jgi:hypothetical protein
MASFILGQIEELSWSGIASGMKTVRYRSAREAVTSVDEI